MDVYQTIKVNKLVSEFKKHGLATDEEAIKKARQMITKDPAANEPQKTEQQPTGEQTMDDQSIMNIINRKIFYQAEQTDKKMKEETDKIRAEMSTMSNEIRMLRETIKAIAAMKQAAAQSGQQTLQTQQPEQAAPQPPKSKRGVDNEPVKPRTGDYKPGDVDLNDMFNYGKR